MSDARKLLQTGIPNLDTLLGGGFPAGDLVLVMGAPGAGKTTMVFQMAFHVAASGGNAVYVSTLSEPASQLVRHLRTFSFWSDQVVGKQLSMENILPVLQQGIDKLIGALVDTVKARRADLLIVDGLMTVRDVQTDPATVRSFVSQLSVALGPLGCRCVLTSSNIPEMRGNIPAELTMCDGIIELGQRDLGWRTERTIRIWKMRGAASVLGKHSMQIGGAGISVFPRIETWKVSPPASFSSERVTTGSPELDHMMSGGLPRGSCTLMAGASATGKTIMMLQFLLHGAHRGEKGLLVGFREPATQLVQKAQAVGLDLEGALDSGMVQVFHRLPVDIEVDELLSRVWSTVETMDARRVGVDSACELLDAIPAPRQRGATAALTEFIRSRGVTAVVNHESSAGPAGQHDLKGAALASMAQNVVSLRQEHRDGRLRRLVSVLKMRDSVHDHSVRQYDIGSAGLRIFDRGETASSLDRESQ